MTFQSLVLKAMAPSPLGIILNIDAYLLFARRREKWFSVQATTRRGTKETHVAKTAGIKVACSVNPEI